MQFKKQYPFLIILILISINLNGQDSQFIPDENAYWNINRVSWGNFTPLPPIGVLGDTLISGENYIKIYQSTELDWQEGDKEYFCAAREDSGKWLFIPESDSVEYLLYDFNVHVGDTIQINNPWTTGEVETLITSIDSIEINGEMRKRIHSDNLDQGNFFDEWIEGIGSIHGLVYGTSYATDGGHVLICHFHNDILLYQYWNAEDCIHDVSIKEVEEEDYFSVYPNPAKENLTLSIRNGLPLPKSISIITLEGKTKYYSEDFRSLTVKISHLENGLYFLKFTQENGLETIRKFIIRRD